MKRIIIVLIVFSVSLFYSTQLTYSDQLDDVNKQLSELTNALNQSKNATKPLESQFNNLQKQVKDIKNNVINIEIDILLKKKNINEGYRKLIKQEEILHLAIRDYYIQSYYNTTLHALLSSTSATKMTQLLAYQKAAEDQDKAIIANIALSLNSLETKKKNLENEQIKLTVLKITLDEQSKKLDDVVRGAKAYQVTLSNQIAQLSAQQQQLISQKLGSLNIPKSAGSTVSACVNDREIDPGFSQAIAFFTYGVPNRVGLSQYGAFGRSKAGQNSEEILRAYYANYELRKDYSQDIIINVTGSGSFKIEEYLKHLGEMPESWGNQGGLEALKAQAIAARSYALAYTNNGQGPICGTDLCQVFLANEKGGKWNEAVEATKGWVMMQGDKPVKAWFSSTHGGYIHSSGDIGWSETSWTKNSNDANGNTGNFNELQNNAYDRESPWFYCDWGSRSEFKKTAWLRKEEVADIVNVILLARADSSTKDHFYQVDHAHPYGGEIWNEEKVKSELNSRSITPFNSVTDVSLNTDFGSGKVTSVNISGDAGQESFNGSEFKDWFNLRAPANIQIVGPLFNVERK
ncbi:hypothetical protein LBMAG33_5310 [Candidatus Levyibacteriota bacterium]|nr:hypothetical protein [Candidatus Levybacteria bacterium]GDX62221.1 hypothetical protein LBMAG33_5310 [Candidatus Levybacteria bacterium]